MRPSGRYIVIGLFFVSLAVASAASADDALSLVSARVAVRHFAADGNYMWGEVPMKVDVAWGRNWLEGKE